MDRWFSAKELAALNPRGLRIPSSERGCRNLAKREEWPSKEVQGKGGRGGVLTLFRPPDALLTQIAAIESGPAVGVALKEYEKPVSANPLASGDKEASRFILESDITNSQKEMLEAILRIAEYKVSHDQVTPPMIRTVLAASRDWMNVAVRYPEIEARLKAVIAAYEFLNSIGRS